MAVQQHRVSKQRYRQRRAANRYKGLQTAICPQCDSAKMPHHVCPKCGSYRGRQIITIQT